MLTRRGFLTSLPLLGLAGCSRKGSEEGVRLGHVGAFGGPDRAAEESLRRGILLAVEEVNAQDDRIDGRKLSVLHADGKGDADRTRQEAVRLIALQRPAALIGGRDQATTDRLVQALGTYPVPLLTVAPSGMPNVDGVFAIDVSPDFRGECLARFASEDLKARKAVLISDVSSAVDGATASAFARKWRSFSGHTLRELDAEDVVKKLGMGDTALLVVAAGAEVVKSVRAAKIVTPIVFAGEGVQCRKLDAEADVHAAVVHASAGFVEEGKKVVESFRKKFGMDPDEDACCGYELVRLLAQALQRTKGTGGHRLRDELGNDENKVNGLTGAVSFKKGCAVRPLFVVKQGATSIARTFAVE